MPEPEPRTVWMVRPGRPDAAPGELAVDPDALTFSPPDAGPTRIPLAAIRRARRRRGTPILEVRHGAEGVAFFYFEEPPPLESTAAGGPISMFRPSRSIQRSAGIKSLQAGGRRRRDEIEAWVRAIRERAGG